MTGDNTGDGNGDNLEMLQALMGDNMERDFFTFEGGENGIFETLGPGCGVTSFMRLPLSRKLDDIDIAIYAIPIDYTSTNRPGSRFGPRAVREHSLLLGAVTDPLVPHEKRLRDHVRMIDYGDIIGEFGYVDSMLDEAEKHLGRIVDHGVATLGLGGEHLITYPALKEHARRHGPLSLIHFDAHSDDSSLGRLNHGSMFYYACEEGLIDPERSIQVGLRHTLPEHDFNVLHAHECFGLTGAEIAAHVKRVVGDRTCFLTLDVDGMDPAFAPGTGTPVPGGLTSMQQREALWNLKDVDVIGADLVEVSPPFDPTGQTANLGAGLAIDLLHILMEARLRRTA